MAIEQVVVFDLDDTLYLERDYVVSGLSAVAAWAHAQRAITGLEEAMLALFAEGVRGRIFDAALAECGHDASPSLIAKMLTVYRQHRPHIRLAPDAEAYLASPPPGAAIAIITDGFMDAQRRKLRALDVHRRGVAVAVCTDRWGRNGWKPNPAGFRYMQDRFGLPPDRFSYVADNPTKDFHAPHQLGWATVQIARPGRLHIQNGQKHIAAQREVQTFAML